MNTNNIQKVNYQKILDKITDKIEKECAEGENRPALFLHACCAPCSSYVLEYLTKYFKITIFYYNPNITPETEYTKRVKELQRFIHEAGYEEDVTFVEGDYDPQVFLIWQGEWKTCRKEDFAVITATHFVWKKPRRKLQRWERIIFRQPFQSARTKMPSGLMRLEKNLLINMG